MQYGLILTHNLSTIITAFFSLLYLGLNFKKVKEEKDIRKKLLINIIFILTISCFYWMPFVETSFFTKYQVYEEGMMSTPELTAERGLSIKQLFVTLNNGSYVFELGPHIILMLAFSIFTFKKIKPELKEQYGFFLFSGIITLWMSTKYFPWKFLPQEFSFIQFPWRMLMLSSFFLSIVCAINMSEVIKAFNYKDALVISAISIIYIVALSGLLVKYTENIENIENIHLGNISGREFETVAGTAKAEYLPVNAYKNRFYIATRDDFIDIIEGKAIIEDEVKNGSNYKAKIKTLETEYTIFELPYIYYPGYKVTSDGMQIDTFETKNGFIGFALYKDENIDLEVTYTGTSLMKISMLISFLSLITFLVCIVKKPENLKNEEK